MSTGERITGVDIGTIGITVDAAAGIDGHALAHHLQAQLRAIRLPQPSAGLAIDRLDLGAVAARPGETVDLLAARVAGVLEATLVARLVASETEGAS
jgi:hypothetical protein